MPTQIYHRARTVKLHDLSSFNPSNLLVPSACIVLAGRTKAKSKHGVAWSWSVSLGFVPTWSPCTSLQGRSCHHIRRTWFSGMPALSATKPAASAGPQEGLQRIQGKDRFPASTGQFGQSCSDPCADLLVVQDELFQLLPTCCNTSAVCVAYFDTGAPKLRKCAFWMLLASWIVLGFSWL